MAKRSSSWASRFIFSILCESIAMRREPEETTPVLSVVIPVFNEEECLEEIHRRITIVMRSIVSRYEILFVDDGSKDRSREIVRSLAAEDPCVRGVLLSRNFGQHIAITAGMAESRGKGVVILDADLQDPPETIPDFFEAFQAGSEVVVSIRSQRYDPWTKRVFSWLFWSLINKIAEVPVPRNQSMLRLLSRRACDAILKMGERSRFIGGQVAWIGFRLTEIPVSNDPRHAGVSKYGFWKSVKLLYNAVTSFSTYPLRLISSIGWLIACTSLIVGAILTFLKSTRIVDFASGWASMFVLVSFFGGLNIAMLGVIGLYLGRVYQQAMDRPLYLIEELVGGTRHSSDPAGTPNDGSILREAGQFGEGF